MHKAVLRYWVLWLFLLGIIFIVFLQVLSGNNINNLIKGNDKLNAEMQVQITMRRLQNDVLAVESDIRGAVVTNNPEYLSEVAQKINSINREMPQMQKHFDSGALLSEYQKLQSLVRRKVAFSNDILSIYRQQGKEAAEQYISTNRGRNLRDSIELAITQLKQLRQTELDKLSNSFKETGRSTRFWGFGIGVIALIAVVSAFWYMLNQGRQQQRMIALLNESEKKSKEVASMKEQFLANMSHEIRTPMNAILGFTNLIRRTQLNGEQRQYVQNIHSAGENLLALVNDILDLSKIEAGMMSLEETRFSLHSLLSSVGAMFSEKVKEKKLELTIMIDKDIPDVLSGDAVRLTQILVNLISNAVKFTEQGRIEVEIRMVEQTKSEVRLQITIADTGIGISAEKLQSIFERFQQADTETTRRFGGTGLGLAIVKQLVTLQNGTIVVKSKQGKGSKFIVELTYRIPDIDQLYAAALSAQEEMVPLEKISVLIAEDNVMNQQLISHLMRSWGIDFTLVNNGLEVLDQLKQRSFSIVLMDIQMPGMDGYTATAVIRKELGLTIPIIAMTAHAMTGEKEKCLQLGMNDYVSKPIKETVLYNIIGRHAQNLPEVEKCDEKLNGSPVNLEYLSQLSGGDKTFERQILEQFVVQMPEEVQQLEEAIHKRDFDGVKSIAHSLKSTVGYVGLSDELHPYLDRLEKEAIKGEDTHFTADFNPVKSRCAQAKTGIENLLNAETV